MMHHHDSNEPTMVAPLDSGCGLYKDKHTRSKIPESFTSYLEGMFDSDDDDWTTSSREVMPPPGYRPSDKDSSSSDDIQSEKGYESEESTSISDISNESEENFKWELAYLQKKRRLLTRACNVLDGEKSYDASIAKNLLSTVQQDTPLWMEAREMVGIKTKTNDPPQENTSLAGNKRSRIDLSSVSLINGNVEGHENVTPPIFCVSEKKATSGIVASVSPGGSDSAPDGNDSENSTCTMNLEHAIAFSTVAQVLALALPPCTIVHANRAFSEFSGLSNEQLQGHTLGSILIAAKHDTQVHDHFVDAFLTGVNDSRTCRMRTVSVREAPTKILSPITHWLVQVESPERHGIYHSAIA